MDLWILVIFSLVSPPGISDADAGTTSLKKAPIIEGDTDNHPKIHIPAFHRYGVKFMVDDVLFPPHGYQPAFPIDNMQKRMSIRFTSPCLQRVRYVHLYARTSGAPGRVKVSMKDDSGYGRPVEGPVPESAVVQPVTGWSRIPLDAGKKIETGGIYHVVVEPHTGPFDGDNRVEYIASVSRPTIPYHPFCGEQPMISFHDPELAYLFDEGDGNSFLARRGMYNQNVFNVFNPVFVVELEDGSALGQPYDRHETFSIAGSDWYGQAIVFDAPIEVNYVVFFTCGEDAWKPLDHLWFDLYRLEQGTAVPVLQDIKVADKGGCLHTYRTHWFGVNLPITVSISRDDTCYFVLKSPGSLPGHGYVFPFDGTTVKLSDESRIPTYGGQSAYCVVSRDGGSTFERLAGRTDTGIMLGFLAGGDEGRPIAFFDEIYDFPLAAKGGESILLHITNRNIGEDGSLYARVYDHEILAVLGFDTLPDVMRNTEKKHEIHVSMPERDLRILVECGHFGPKAEEVPDDFAFFEIRFDKNQTLTAEGYTVRERAGGTVHFTLDAGAANANREYLLLGSTSGTAPGTWLPNGHVILPLNWDHFTNLVIQNIGTPTFRGFQGTLNKEGRGEAQWILQSLPKGCAGDRWHFSFALNLPWDFVSNPVAIDAVR